MQTAPDYAAMMPALPGSIAAPPSAPQLAVPPGEGVPRFILVPKYIGGTWVNVEYVDILTPGDPKASPRHKVTDGIRQAYAKAYADWRNGLEAAPVGWAIEHWPVLNPAQVLNLKALNIFTVEQLAQMADGNLHHIPMGKTLKNQAIAAITAKEKSDAVEVTRRENESLKGSVKFMEDQMAAMQAQIAALTAANGGGQAVVAPTLPNGEPIDALYEKPKRSRPAKTVEPLPDDDMPA